MAGKVRGHQKKLLEIFFSVKHFLEVRDNFSARLYYLGYFSFLVNYFLMSISFTFHKDLSFRCGDIALFVTLYNLEVKMLGFFFILNYSQK